MWSVPITTKCCEFESHSWWGVLNTTLCDKVCQWIATGRYFRQILRLKSSTNFNSILYFSYNADNRMNRLINFVYILFYFTSNLYLHFQDFSHIHLFTITTIAIYLPESWIQIKLIIQKSLLFFSYVMMIELLIAFSYEVYVPQMGDTCNW
jgi:hypothetical protein